MTSYIWMYEVTPPPHTHTQWKMMSRIESLSRLRQIFYLFTFKDFSSDWIFKRICLAVNVNCIQHVNAVVTQPFRFLCGVWLHNPAEWFVERIDFFQLLINVHSAAWRCHRHVLHNTCLQCNLSSWSQIWISGSFSTSVSFSFQTHAV